MVSSIRSAVAHLARQPKLLALALSISAATSFAVASGSRLGAQTSVPGGVGGIGGIWGLGGIGGEAGVPTLLHPIIVDDGAGESRFVSITTNPLTTGFSGDSRTVNANSWVFPDLAAGTYDVYATWVAAPQNSTETTYKVLRTLNGQSTSEVLPNVTVNQALAPTDAIYFGMWKQLGTVEMATAGEIHVGGATERFAVVDAIALQPRFADLAILKTGPATVQRGGEIAYTIQVKNSGSYLDSGVKITDPVPAGLTFIDSEECSLNAAGTAVECPMTLQPGESRQRTLRFAVSATAACSVIANQATVSGSLPEFDPRDNRSAIVSTSVVCPEPDLRITKTAENIVGSRTIAYTITVTNTSSVQASGVTVTDTLPSTLSVGTGSTAGWVQNGATLTYTLGNIDPGQTRSIVLRTQYVQAACYTSVENTATVESDKTDGNPADNTSSVVTTLACTQCNDDRDNDNDGVKDHPADNSCSSKDDDDETNPKAQCQDGVDNDADGDIDFGTTEANDPGCSYLQDNSELHADLELTFSGPSSVIQSAGRVIYQLTLRNLGPSSIRPSTLSVPYPPGVTIESVTPDCTRPAGMAVCLIGGPLSPGSVITKTVTVLIPSACNSQINLTARFNNSDSVAEINPSNNNAQITTTVTCPVACNDGIDNDGDGKIDFGTAATNDNGCSDAQDNDEFNPIADLSITKTGTGSINRFGIAPYTILVTNNGPSVAANVTVKDAIPAGTAFNATGSTVGWIVSGGTGTFLIPQLAVGETRTLTLRLKATTAPCYVALSNTASVASSLEDRNMNNNRSTAFTNIACYQCSDGIDNDGDGKIDYGSGITNDLGCYGGPQDNTEDTPVSDVRVTATGALTAQKGVGTVTYNVAVTNLGPNNLDSVQISTVIPNNFQPVNLPSGCLRAGVAIFCQLTAIPVGTTQTKAITYDIASASCEQNAQHTFSASNQMPTDPVSTNNQATVTTRVTCPAPASSSSSSIASSSSSTAATGPAQGNLLLYMVGETRRQVLAGTLSEPVFSFTMQARGTESVRVKRIALRTFSNINLNAIDRVELYDGTQLKATLTPNGCGDTLPSTVCSDLTTPIVLQAQQSMYLRAKVLIKPDTAVQSSGEVVQFRIEHVAGKAEFIAEGVTTGRPLVTNNGNGAAEGEIFYGRSMPGGTDAVHAGVVHQIVHTKLASITNANPDADNTAIPTGVAPVGQFRFTAATNVNSLNGLNRFTVRSIRFVVDSANVQMLRDGFKAYNKQDATQKVDCSGASAITTTSGVPITTNTVQGAFYVTCDFTALAGLREVGSGETHTFVLEANISNTKILSSSPSRLVVMLPNINAVSSTLTPPTLGLGNKTIEWTDKDSALARDFGWSEFFTIFSTRYRTN